MNLDTTVRRATNVKFEVDSSNEVIVYTDKGRFNAGHSSLRILERCFTPCSVRNLLEEMVDPDKREASKEILRTLKALFSSGAIVESEGSGLSSSMFPFGGYAAPFVQTKMLNDVLRKQIYLDAIRDLVKPEDIVIDLGTGSGLCRLLRPKQAQNGFMQLSLQVHFTALKKTSELIMWMESFVLLKVVNGCRFA